ncbi:hypothetical protein BJV77DRAFT_240067 [Russula vinacea]|nr:hypothetical protein BJV77DRAFT_240067 [Russula vinacea]
MYRLPHPLVFPRLSLPAPPEPHSPCVLTIPREFTARQLFLNCHADPLNSNSPTGHNSEGASIVEEFILRVPVGQQDKCLLGNDTWLTVFPTLFHQEMSHGFNSLEAEDLHTVNAVVDDPFSIRLLRK